MSTEYDVINTNGGIDSAIIDELANACLRVHFRHEPGAGAYQFEPYAERILHDYQIAEAVLARICLYGNDARWSVHAVRGALAALNASQSGVCQRWRPVCLMHDGTVWEKPMAAQTWVIMPAINYVEVTCLDLNNTEADTTMRGDDQVPTRTRWVQFSRIYDPETVGFHLPSPACLNDKRTIALYKQVDGDTTKF